MRKYVLAALLAVLMLNLGAVNADAQNTVIAVVDAHKIFENYKATAAVFEQLKQEEEKLQADLDKEQDELRVMKEELEKNWETLSESDRERRATELQRRMARLHNKFQELNEKLGNDRNKALKLLEDEILKVVEKIGKDKKYTIVVEKSTVLFGGVDITDDVLKELNR